MNLQDHPTLLLELALLCLWKVLPFLWTLPPAPSAPYSPKLKMCPRVKSDSINCELVHQQILEMTSFLSVKML